MKTTIWGRNGESGSRSTYRRKLVSEGLTSEDQVIELKVSEDADEG